MKRDLPRLFVDESMPAMAWAARPDMSCEFVSRAWLEFTGVDAQAALGGGWSQSVHPEDLERWLDTLLRAFDARAPFSIEYRLRSRNGGYRWVLDHGVPRTSADGAFLGFAGVGVDIHERHVHEAELAQGLERERRQRTAAEETCRIVAGLLDLSHGRPILGGVRVLVVDDDPAGREAVVRMLGIAGAEIRAVCSPAEALEALKAFRADVVLSSFGMRGTEGYGLFRALRALPAEKGGCPRAAQLVKPVEPLSLLATVGRLAMPAGAF